MYFFFSSRRRHTRCALVTGVQTCALPILGNPKKTLQAGELGKTRIADHLAVRRRTDALMVLATAAPTQVQIFTRRRNRPDDDEYDQWGVQPPSDHYADNADDRSDRHLPAEHIKQETGRPSRGEKGGQ